MSAYQSLYGEHFEYELSGERRRFKGDKRWFIKCEECSEWEWYPVQEHKAWHFLYENMAELATRARYTAIELRQIIGGKNFTYKETMGDEFIFTVTLRKAKAKPVEGAPES